MDKVMCGGCLCGSVRYEYDGQPGNSSYCHCDDCKRATGGPYTVGVLSKADKLRIVSGKVKGYTTVGDSGNEITRQFCPECGSPLFTRGEKDPDLVFMLMRVCQLIRKAARPSRRIQRSKEAGRFNVLMGELLKVKTRGKKWKKSV